MIHNPIILTSLPVQAGSSTTEVNMAKKKAKREPAKTRNLLHDHPLMRKCSVHRKSNGAKRRADRIRLRGEYPDQWILCFA